MSCTNLLFISSILVFLLNFVSGANILYMSLVTSPSHHFWNSALVNELAARGHNVTVLSGSKDKNPPNRVHNLILDGIYSDDYDLAMNGLYNHTMDPAAEPQLFDEFCYAICEIAMKSNGVRTLLEYPDDFHFDMVIHDYAMGGCLLGFMKKFKNPPLIAVTAYNNPSFSVTLVGGHQFYSYVPHFYLDYQDDMNLFQRMYNFYIHMLELYSRVQINQKLDMLLKGTFGPGLQTVTELEQRTALALVSTNPAFDYMAPLPENVIPVAGLQIKNTKPLPKDLEEYITSAKKGAILFSLGSNIQSSAMNRDKQKMILDAFEQFPDYHFLWKFEEHSTGLKLPKNVIIRPWLPQSDILAHPKIRAFFTHSGLLSTHETIWRGVPILGMPFGFDQNANLLKSIRGGFAEKVDYHTMTTEILRGKLEKILNNPKYYENAKKVSARFRDQKETPLERAVWWIEWIIRNPDCDYLKSPVLRLGFLVGNSYDLIAIISIVSFITVVLVIKLCCHILRNLTKQKNRPHEKLQ